jgi:DNA repair exonuclease SbcCD nuclease subunit
MWQIELPKAPTKHTYPVAICLSDVHLSDKPPPRRETETDWIKAQLSYLAQVIHIRKKLSHDNVSCESIPILIAGDIFDTWRGPHRLTNAFMEWLRRRDAEKFYTVAGQHEMPYHNIGLIDQSPYATIHTLDHLVQLSSVSPIDKATRDHRLEIYGFDWGAELPTAWGDKDEETIRIAVVHDYCWKDGHTFPGAPQDKYWKAQAEKYATRNFDIAIFGDNHSPFEGKHDGVFVYNCGAFTRRRDEEERHRPSVGIVYSNKTVRRAYLDISEDTWVKSVKKDKAKSSMSETIAKLGEMVGKCEDFKTMCLAQLESIGADPDLREEVQSALEGRE